MQIVTVLKSGGSYKPDHLARLYGGCLKWSRGVFDFICLTDFPEKEIREAHINIRPVPLKNNWPGWWSKLELFRGDFSEAPRMLYLDLDTVPVGPFRGIWECEDPFLALKDFNKGTLATGLMVWNGDYSFLYEAAGGFIEKMGITSENWKKTWDQRFVAEWLKKKKVPITFVQDKFPNWVVSYKKHCEQGLPEDARIVCFHGKPRPWEVAKPWIKENWRKQHVSRFRKSSPRNSSDS